MCNAAGLRPVNSAARDGVQRGERQLVEGGIRRREDREGALAAERVDQAGGLDGLDDLCPQVGVRLAVVVAAAAVGVFGVLVAVARGVAAHEAGVVADVDTAQVNVIATLAT